jgi:hypothetical protein
MAVLLFLYFMCVPEADGFVVEGRREVRAVVGPVAPPARCFGVTLIVQLRTKPLNN